MIWRSVWMSFFAKPSTKAEARQQVGHCSSQVASTRKPARRSACLGRSLVIRLPSVRGMRPLAKMLLTLLALIGSAKCFDRNNFRTIYSSLDFPGGGTACTRMSCCRISKQELASMVVSLTVIVKVRTSFEDSGRGTVMATDSAWY
ncbi:hypothetical protein AVEN_86918-1 [Araneus ventricosus]|uniref:Uncharacterized protein n=1 Tax=Araneus ventricosus TaxID=182803 RepID=A0A4Y2RPX5_ARAVE|nr:hypothetical protein AVEN_86918-1 [Araneus ventricosus]